MFEIDGVEVKVPCKDCSGGWQGAMICRTCDGRGIVITEYAGIVARDGTATILQRGYG